MTTHVLAHWNPEDAAFWESEGRAIASRNLWISIPSLTLAFAVWMVWSVVVVNLPNVGFKFSTEQLFWLAALPSLCGATLRIFYSFMVPIFGGRRWTAISTASLLLPTIGIGFAVRDPATSYSTLVVLALLCGFGGGNFASSMANINFFFPKAQKGTALGLNAGLGNLGVSLVQFVVPLVITAGVFGALGGEPQAWTKGAEVKQMWLQNAGFIWVPFIAIFALAAWFGMNDLASAKASFSDQAVIFKRKHNWIMCWLYLGTFGSFIGYSAGFPLLIKSQFPQINALSYAWLGPLVGALIRPLGGWLSDKLGGARVTFWTIPCDGGGRARRAVLPAAGRAGRQFLRLPRDVHGAVRCRRHRQRLDLSHDPGHFHERAPARSRGQGQGGRGAGGARCQQGGGGRAWFLLGDGGLRWLLHSNELWHLDCHVRRTGLRACTCSSSFYATCIAMTWWYYARRNAPMPC